jgi:hypothetical protein
MLVSPASRMDAPVFLYRTEVAGNTLGGSLGRDGLRLSDRGCQCMITRLTGHQLDIL